MKIDATKDFKRPRGKVFASFSDPARVDAVLGSVGTQLRREGAGDVGSVWHMVVSVGGKERPVSVTLAERIAADTIRLAATSDMVDVDMVFSFADMPDEGCKVTSEATLTPRTLAARVGLQTLRLAKGKIEQRLVRAMTALGKPG
ncbi:MAG: SRPBCC family protein [Pararhodobacter sp.]|nr:SRPBCC family protein [Pararhodobacter sp.]